MERLKIAIMRKYISYYRLVLLMPLTVVITVYLWTTDIVKNKTFVANKSVLQHNVEIMENSLADIKNLVYQIGTKPSINIFIRNSSHFNDKSALSDVRDAQTLLASYALTNNYINRIQVYSSKGNVVIGKITSFIRINFLYHLSFTYQGMSYNEWVNPVFLKTHQNQIWPARL